MIAVGDVFTVTGFVTKHPEVIVYFTVSAPPEIPVNIPVNAPIVPTAVILLLHVPPDKVSLKESVAPAHSAARPAMADGGVLTVTVFVATQPVGKLYEIVAVPNDTGVTIPVDEPIDTAGPLSLHTPPVAESLRVIGEPHKMGDPVIGCKLFTVTV